MTNLTENSVWESGIYQLETDDPTLGGPPGFNLGEPVTGHANAQAQQLANRTSYLKQRVDVDLANSFDQTKGASLVGYRGYSVHNALDVRTTNRQWGINPSTTVAIDDSLDVMTSQLKNTGYTVTFLPGNYRITKAHTIEGFNLVLNDGAEIEVFGSDGSLFSNGALILKNKGTLTGGVVFTNGTMTATPGSRVIVQQFDGCVKGTTIYSQLDEVVFHVSGDIDVTIYGGSGRGLRSHPNIDLPINYNVKWRNIGTRYINKVPVGVTATDSRAFHIYPQVTINSPVRVNIDGWYSWKNGAWIGGTLFKMYDVVINGTSNKAGFYLDSNGVEQIGHGAGTCIEVENCPNAVVTAVTAYPSGYNVAIANGCDYASVIGGYHRGVGGDPNIVVSASNNVTVSSYTHRGSVGVSVGEDGATSNNCKIINHVFDECDSSPVRFDSGSCITIQNCSFKGEPTQTALTGSWDNYSRIKPAVVVYSNANDIILCGNSFSGWFSHDVIDYGQSGRLRVSRNGNTYNCPILAREDIQYQALNTKIEGTSRISRVLNDNDVSGYAGVGEISILSTAPQQYTILPINPALSNLNSLAYAGESIDAVLEKYAVVIYVKYTQPANGASLRFGISSDFNASHVNIVFPSPYGTGVIGENSISGKTHPLNVGEWFPVIAPLKNIIRANTMYGNLQYFIVNKFTNGNLYDLLITKPVLVYIGENRRV